MKKVPDVPLHMLAVLITCVTFASAEVSQPIRLPEPKLDQGRLMMQVSKAKETVRDYGPKELSPQTLSNLLCAASGADMEKTGRSYVRTSGNRHKIDMYVSTAMGLYVYDRNTNSLTPIVAEDVRAMTGRQTYVKDAPVNLIFVADFDNMGDEDDAAKAFIAGADAGLASENVYLYCASEGLGTAVRTSIDRDKLAHLMKLRPEQRITLAHSVGYPRPRAGK